MRGDDNQQEGMFSYISPERRVPADHPLRPIRKIVDEILKEMSPKFQKLYSDVGRPSIAPERLLRSLLLQIFYSVRSERMLIEQLQYNLLFRWFVGMEMEEAVWNHAVYSKNRERLLNEEIAESFFQRVLERAKPYTAREILLMQLAYWLHGLNLIHKVLHLGRSWTRAATLPLLLDGTLPDVSQENELPGFSGTDGTYILRGNRPAVHQVYYNNEQIGRQGSDILAKLPLGHARKGCVQFSAAMNYLCTDEQPRTGISLFCIDTGAKANLNKLNQFGTE